MSATPVVLDVWPRNGRAAEEIVARSCELGGLPRPSEVEILPSSAVAGTPLFRRMDTIRRPGDPVHPVAHDALSFPTPVMGPVVIGHMRHYGLGLCIPAGAS